MFLCLVGFSQKKTVIISPYCVKAMTISRLLSPIEFMTVRRRAEIVKYFRYLGSMTTNDIRCTRQIKPRIAMAKAESNKKKTLFTSKLV